MLIHKYIICFKDFKEILVMQKINHMFLCLTRKKNMINKNKLKYLELLKKLMKKIIMIKFSYIKKIKNLD
jgi:hypothetical protein